MKIDCRQVWREISNYIDDDLSPALREELELHLAQCKHCAALLDSTHNLLVLLADERRFELPPRLSQRLRQKLTAEIAAGR
ncbi:MAG: zf-HC2 domain-containing protein [Acidobacteriales bacterium]|nr:zf-HC2 domain-containing protein [Terriglobales bacterium]